MSPVVPVLSTVVYAVSAAASDSLGGGDLEAALTQLGVGGVLVAVIAAVYRRFEARADKRDLDHKADLERERVAHDMTRQALIEALRKQEK